MSRSILLDLKDEKCPEPLVKVMKTLAEASLGDEIVVITNIEECVKLITETIRSLNVADVNVHKEVEHYRIHIKKTEEGIIPSDIEYKC